MTFPAHFVDLNVDVRFSAVWETGRQVLADLGFDPGQCIILETGSGGIERRSSELVFAHIYLVRVPDVEPAIFHLEWNYDQTQLEAFRERAFFDEDDFDFEALEEQDAPDLFWAFYVIGDGRWDEFDRVVRNRSHLVN